MLDFIHALEKLKCETRHSYKSNNSPETVVEHCWRVSMLLLLFKDRYPLLDINKCIKMALIHDLPEIITGDAYKLDPVKQAEIKNDEKTAMKKLVEMLPPNVGNEIMSLWLEFEEMKTDEARLVNLIDRLEVLIQHNETDISNWNNLEKNIHYGLASRHARKYDYLSDFASEVDNETGEKMLKAGLKPEIISLQDYEKYYGT